MKYDIIQSINSSRTLCMPHQQDAVDALNSYYDTDSPQHPQSGLLVMPTGSGKTFTTVNWLLNTGIKNGYRILWLVHRQELIDQTYCEFEKQLGVLSDYGIKTINMMRISGGPGHNLMSQASRQDIYVCSILSVASKNGQRFIRRMLGAPGAEKLIVVIDEAHHSTAPSYQKVFDKIGRINPNRILLGLTATPIRMRQDETQKLNEMYDSVHDAINNEKAVPINYIYEVSLSDLIKSGFLAKPYYKYIQTEINGDIEYNLSEDDIRFFERFGELTESLKTKLASSQSRNQIILKEYLNNRKHYGKTLIFAINQLHAELLSRLFIENGIKCDYAISNRQDSYNVITNFKSGKLDVLINVQMLTEGSDVPDIKSVFITRETNSDSLLMQMVGRGLRGVNAGGTKDAFIVSFHDTWDRITYWMKPEFVTAIVDSISEVTEETTGGEKLLIEQPPVTLEGFEQPNGLTLKVLYEKLYSAMKVNITSEVVSDLIPDGWYAVLAEDGSDINISVYRDQLLGYQLMEASIGWIVKNNPSGQSILTCFFNECYVIPADSDIKVIIEHILDNGKMPDYYTFKDRDKIAPEAIAHKMIEYSPDKDVQIYWLESYYKEHSILKQIYRTFLAFRKSVTDTMVKPREAEVVFIDDREEYKIVTGYHDLSSLYNKLIKQHPEFGKLPVNSISWSNSVVKSWLGMCYKLPDDTYTIFINRLLCSPLISKDSIMYLIYHELLHASGLWSHNDAFREQEWIYPNSDELDGELDEIGLKYNVDFKSLKQTTFKNTGSINTKPEKKVDAGTEKANETRKQNFCRDCGNKLPVEAQFCDVCGVMMVDY